MGYAPQLVDTGLHALDGARHLRSGWKPLVCQLVAYHSAALVEAEERGLRAELRQFACPDEFLLDALTYSDMTTSPTGLPVNVEDRLQEILERYPPDDPVYRAVRRSAPLIKAAVERTEHRLAGSEHYPM